MLILSVAGNCINTWEILSRILGKQSSFDVVVGFSLPGIRWEFFALRSSSLARCH
jgi:hypothetical protein